MQPDRAAAADPVARDELDRCLLRVLSRMRKDGILHEERHHFVVLDEARLIEMAGLEDEGEGLSRAAQRLSSCLGCLAS